MPKYSEKTLNNRKEALVEALLEIEKCRKTKSKTLEIGYNGYLTVFSEEIRELTWLTSLLVVCTDIREIPDWIDELKDLKVIDFRTNKRLRKLPSSLVNLKKLKKLVIDNTGLKNLPLFLGEMHSLEYIEIGPYNLKTIPQSILDLPKLKRIETSGYNTRHLPLLEAKQIELDLRECLRRIERCKKKKSKKLDLSYLHLSELPENLSSLSCLEELILDCNDLKLIPEWIGNLKNLTDLNIDYNEKLTVLPNSIGKLSKLKKINLGSCKLVTLPDTFCNLLSLEEFYMDRNRIKRLPESFGNLSSLKIFGIVNSRLNGLPETFGKLHSLEEIYIDRCSSGSFNFPKSMKNLNKLRSLTLSDFNDVPEFIGEMVNLTKLDLSHNFLDFLPDFIGNLKKLKMLNLHSTWITELPEWIGNLKNLEDLITDFPVDQDTLLKKLPKLKNYHN